MRRNWTPSIVPSGDDQTVYLVINNFGNLGAAFPETDVDKADLETIMGDLMSGQYSDPVRVVTFNTAEQWSADVSQDVAYEIRRRADLAGDDLAPSIAEFVEAHAGPARLQRPTSPRIRPGPQSCRCGPNRRPCLPAPRK